MYYWVHLQITKSARQEYWWVLCDILNVVAKEKIQMAFLGIKDLDVQLQYNKFDVILTVHRR